MKGKEITKGNDLADAKALIDRMLYRLNKEERNELLKKLLDLTATLIK